MSREQPRIVIPPAVRKDDVVKADDFNKLRNAIIQLQGMVQARTPMGGPDIGHRYGPGGFSTFLKRRGGAGGPGGSKYQFRVNVTKTVEEETTTYHATVVPGYLRYKDPMVTEDNPITDWMPTLGGTPLDETVGDPAAPPKIAVANGDFIYLHFFTDSHGFIEETPTIQVNDGSEAITVHYQPGEKEPVDGEYWLRIARITISEEGKVTIRQYQQGGPVEFVPNLFTYKQVGGGKEIIKKRDPETDEYVFRTLKERASSPQLTITENTDDITIEGNGYDNAVTEAWKVSLTVVDGFVVDLNYTDLSAEGVRDLNLEVWLWEWSSGGTTLTKGSAPIEIHYWRDGLYKGNTWVDPGDPPPSLITSEVARITAIP